MYHRALIVLSVAVLGVMALPQGYNNGGARGRQLQPQQQQMPLDVSTAAVHHLQNFLRFVVAIQIDWYRQIDNQNNNGLVYNKER